MKFEGKKWLFQGCSLGCSLCCQGTTNQLLLPNFLNFSKLSKSINKLKIDSKKIFDVALFPQPGNSQSLWALKFLLISSFINAIKIASQNSNMNGGKNAMKKLLVTWSNWANTSEELVCSSPHKWSLWTPY